MVISNNTTAMLAIFHFLWSGPVSVRAPQNRVTHTKDKRNCITFIN